MMPQDGGSRNDESFTSFLAGVLYTRKDISNLEFFELMNRFELLYDVAVYSGDEIKIPIYLEDKGIRLNKDYNEIVIIDNKKMTVKEYLYSITSSNVRDFFGISEVIKTDVKVSNTFMKRILKRKIAI